MGKRKPCYYIQTSYPPLVLNHNTYAVVESIPNGTLYSDARIFTKQVHGDVVQYIKKTRDTGNTLTYTRSKSKEMSKNK